MYEPKSLTLHPRDDDEASTFKVGLTRTFGLGDLSHHILISGWAAPEENHVWNDGLEASFAVWMKNPPSRKLLMRVQGSPFIARNVAHQDVTLYFNGFRVGFWRLYGMEKTFLEIEIEPEFWLARLGGAYAKCVWHLPGSLRPSDVTGADDKRQIGFCFQTITFDETLDGAF